MVEVFRGGSFRETWLRTPFSDLDPGFRLSLGVPRMPLQRGLFVEGGAWQISPFHFFSSGT
jgi:hypothetical protein